MTKVHQPPDHAHAAICQACGVAAPSHARYCGSCGRALKAPRGYGRRALLVAAPALVAVSAVVFALTRSDDRTTHTDLASTARRPGPQGPRLGATGQTGKAIGGHSRQRQVQRGAPPPPGTSATGPSRSVAEQYASRTYVVQSGAGIRRFKLYGQSVSVHASDGSALTAFGVLLADSGDGTGQAVLLFRGARFLGWASARDTVKLSLRRGQRSP